MTVDLSTVLILALSVSDGSYEKDCLTYSYNEDGWFWTGPDFGCVHHTEKGVAS